jgi:hypothetical protein
MPSEHTLGDGPISPEYREHMNKLARVLDFALNGEAKGTDRKVGFVLLQFEYGSADGKRCNFISNGADRKDIVVLFKEMIARFEGQPEVKGSA